MLYRFKSKASGDVVMLQPNGKQLLEILGKETDHAGVLLPADIPAAIDAIRAAVLAEEADQKRQREEAASKGEPPPLFETVSLRMRSTPFIEMLERCLGARVEVVWGV